MLSSRDCCSHTSPSWGRMLSDSQTYYRTAPWLMLFPGVAIVYAVVESALSRQPVKISDIFSGDVRQFQSGIEAMGG